MLYLIHFARPYKHARHYRGYCADDALEARLSRHRSGHGARLLAVIAAAGISWELARTWPGGRTQERTLKARKVSTLCPICNPALVSTPTPACRTPRPTAAAVASTGSEIPF